MTARIVEMMKRWWVLALVFALALSLTSCSKKKTKALQQDNSFACDGTLGQFDVALIPTSYNPNLYFLSIIPVQVDGGYPVRIAVANASQAYREVTQPVVPSPGLEIPAGPISIDELQVYDLLVIAPEEPGVSLLDGTSDIEAICTLPLPEDALTDQKR